jgi:hypothetical protein
MDERNMEEEGNDRKGEGWGIGIKIVICTTSYESHTFFHEFVD